MQLCFGKQWDFKNWEALSLHGIRNHLVQLSEGQGTLKISLVISSATTNDSCSLKAMLLNEIAVEDWNFTYNMCAEYLTLHPQSRLNVSQAEAPVCFNRARSVPVMPVVHHTVCTLLPSTPQLCILLPVVHHSDCTLLVAWHTMSLCLTSIASHKIGELAQHPILEHLLLPNHLLPEK